MFIIYDIAFLIYSLFYIPLLFFKSKYHPRFKERFGVFKDVSFDQRPIWIHAVSVGEVMAAKPLLAGLKKEFRDIPILISTITRTGNELAAGLAKKNDKVIFFPLDLSFITARVLDRIRPRLVIIMETEIWPNFIRSSRMRNIPVIVVNARISDRSVGRYRLARPLLIWAFSAVKMFLAQTQKDAERLRMLGVSADRIRVAGNLKFDADTAGNENISGEVLREKLGLRPGDRLLVAGSTHHNEEELLISVYRQLLGRFPDLKLLIAPRHIERSGGICGLIQKNGFTDVRISAFEKEDSSEARGKKVFILDSMGLLKSYYSAADVVFVGGSLVGRGGHNILEPAMFSKPIVFGRHMFNFRDIAELFLQDGSAVMVEDARSLGNVLEDILNSPDKRLELGKKAKRLAMEHKGAADRSLIYIKGLMREDTAK